MIPAINPCCNFFISWWQNKTVCQLLAKRLREILDTNSYFLNSEDAQTVKQAQEYLYTYHSESGADELRRYTLAALKSFSNVEKIISTEDLERIVSESEKSLLAKWTKLNFNRDVFFSHPDFVKFVFKGHLHQYIKKFNHTISSFEYTPHLLVNGKWVDWYEIREKMQIKRGAILDKDNARRYTYLQNGLVPWDPDNWTESISIGRISNPEYEWKLVVVTAMEPLAKRGIMDKLLCKGTRHVFFRLVDPMGNVYSYGLRRNDKDDPFTFDTLANARRVIVSPDIGEFLPHQFLETTVPINDDIAKQIEQHMQQAAREKRPFHYFGTNCTALTREVLQKAGINIEERCHVVTVALMILTSCRPLIWIRKGIESLAKKISPYIPQIAKTIMRYVVHILVMPLVVPVFTILGAWKKGKDGIPPYYSSWKDLFDPDKASVSMPVRIMDWQYSSGRPTILTGG